MGQVLIRELDDAVIERLKQRAQSHHRSLEAELREILEMSRGRSTWRRRGTWLIESAAGSRAVPTVTVRN
jgi:hypothetical protein